MPRTTISIPVPAIDFSPPANNLNGRFNTFRLGLGWSKRVKKGDHVLLLDNKTKTAFARAKVTGVHTGTLREMAALHATHNHNHRHIPEYAAHNLIVAMKKRYGPHIVNEGKKVTVIDLWRLKT